MKTSVRIIAAGLAASLALVSCAKQDAIDNGSANPAGGARTIAVSFANASVKSELGEDGLTPKFVGTDVIKVSNGSATEDCTVSIDGSGNASITTSLTGTLTMVYPSTAAKMNGNAIDGILVPTVQDGTFASANICEATIADGATSASFENQTAVFKVTPPSGVKQFTITSLKPVVDGVARTGTAVAINTEGADDAAKLVITVGSASSELSTFYVSLVAGVNLTDLSFEYKTSEVQGAMKGIPIKSITENSLIDATKASTLYTIDSNNWHDYVVLGGKKWATMNVGATEPEDYGLYFAWGDVVGQTALATTGTSAFSKPFNWSTAPFNNGGRNYNGGYFNIVRSTVCPDDILAEDYDAAHVNWGGSWRMPTKAEFDALIAITDSGWDGSKKGYTFGTSPNQIFLPAAGSGLGTTIYSVGSLAIYWSSSLNTDSIDCACELYFGNDYVGTAGSEDRCLGQSVRPFSE